MTVGSRTPAARFDHRQAAGQRVSTTAPTNLTRDQRPAKAASRGDRHSDPPDLFAVTEQHLSGTSRRSPAAPVPRGHSDTSPTSARASSAWPRSKDAPARRARTRGLGDRRLEYNDASEVAWLVGDDQGDLREACENIARLAPAVAEQTAELEVMAYPLTTTFADRVANGPWCSALGPGDP